MTNEKVNPGEAFAQHLRGELNRRGSDAEALARALFDAEQGAARGGVLDVGSLVVPEPDQADDAEPEPPARPSPLPGGGATPSSTPYDEIGELYAALARNWLGEPNRWDPTFT